MNKYVLEGKEPKLTDDRDEWGRFFESDDRIVAKTNIPECNAEVSTVFLGIDHRFSGDGEPILFESMIFGGEHDGEQQRYVTWDDAEAGHQEMVHRVKISHERTS